MVDVINATEPQLAALAAACHPASFGLAKKDVVDESYRKALKMDSSEFATQFSPLSSGIMEGIRKALFGKRTTENIKVELYKLNVYGISNPFFLSCVNPCLNYFPFQDLDRSSNRMSILHAARAWLDHSWLFFQQNTKAARWYSAMGVANSHSIPPVP
jgi:hypothetical protein